MADLTTGPSSSFADSPEVWKENIPPAKRHYLDEHDFPDLTLLEVTENDDTLHSTTEEISPLPARTFVKFMNGPSQLTSFQTPKMEGNANGSQAETNASHLWVCNESLPDCSHASFDSFMAQGVNFTIGASPSDIQSLCDGAPKASVESNSARAATLGESSKPSPLAASQLSFTQSNECVASTSQEKDPSLGGGAPAEQDGLSSGSTAERPTGDTGAISRSTDRGHHDTFEVCVKGVAETPPSQANGAPSESDAGGVRHGTFDAKPPAWAGGTITLSDGASPDRHRETFDAALPSASGGTVTPPESGLSDGHHDTFDVQPPSHCHGGKSGSRESLDGNPPSFDAQLSKSHGTFTMSESYASDGQRKALDARPAKWSASASCLSGGHRKAFDVPSSSSDRRPNASGAAPPASDGTMSQSLSGEVRHNTFDAEPPSEPNGANVTSGSRSSYALDQKPPSGPSGADDDADAGALQPPQGEASASGAGQREAERHPTLPTHDQSLDRDIGRSFNFDDALHLRRGDFVTSTPLTNCKMTFCASPDEGKLSASSRKPDGETVGKPQVQATPGVASEICTRKILAAAKSLPPLAKAPSLPQKLKPLMLPRRIAVPPSGLHMPKANLATGTLPESSSASSSYKLRSTTTGARPAAQQPKTAAEKPHAGARPSGIPKKGPSLLRPPSTRSGAPASSAVPVLQTRKRNLIRDARLVAKKAKTDVPAASSAIVAPKPSVDAPSAVKSPRPTVKTAKDDAAVSSAATNSASKILKPPVNSRRTHLAAKGSGCANCVVLEAEIRRLKDELQRCKEEKDV